MSKDTYSEVSEYFGIEPLEEVIGVRRDKFFEELLRNRKLLMLSD